MSTNPWIKHVQAYIKKNPGIVYKDALVKAKATYKKGSRKQRGGNMDEGDELGDLDFGDLNLEDYEEETSYLPPMPKTRTPRQDARDTRFMTRKMMNQLIKLKKKNDKYKLGYTLDQLKDMAVRGLTI